MIEYLKIAYRNFLRNKFFSLINIIGLAIGLSSTLLIMIWVNEELSFENFNQNEEKLFRLIAQSNENDVENISALHPVPLAPYLIESYSNIYKATRYSPGWGSLVEYRNNRFKDVKIIEVDPDFFEMFTFPLIEGTKETIFTDIFSVVITEDLCNKIFGNKNPIGELVKINQRNFTVSGIVKNCPENTHIQFDAICLFDSRDEEIKKYIPDDSWGASAYYTYVLLDNSENVKLDEFAITNSLKPVLDDSNKENLYKLQPINRIHLYNNFDDYIGGHGSIKYVYIFSSIALLILIIACINYMNLNTAKYESRAKEVGIRKVCGANRKKLVVQFFMESSLNTFISMLIALVLVELARPVLNNLTGKNLIINYSEFKFWGILILLLIGSTFLSGFYPSIFLSSFKVVNVFKKMTIPLKNSKQNLRLRSILVVFQLIISISLIIIVLFMFTQFKYIQNKNLGYTSENIISFSNSRSFENNIENIKSDFLSHPAIELVAQGNIPTNPNYGTKVKWNGNATNEELEMVVLAVDEDYIQTYGMNIIEGRNFSKEILTDKNESLLINESAARLLNFENPIGQKISYKTPFEGFKEGTIIGVVKDFHTNPLYSIIQPLIINQESFWRYRIGVKFKSNDQLTEVINHLEAVWNKLITDRPFEYFFFKDELSNYYKDESRNFKIISSFTVIAIIISLLGVLGLSYFTTESYSKEIGIRKVLGARLNSLISWFMKDISIKALIASFIAFPLSYYFMDKWIENFAYHINISIWYFIIGWLLTYMLITLIMIIQVVKIAKMNPIESLRYE